MSDEQIVSKYPFRAIETKWQKVWDDTSLFHVQNQSDKPKFYGLVFFPYPSGAGISVGHCKNYVPVDVYCRFKRMSGYHVLQPMGWDAFGQPAENEAIKQGRNPADMVPEYAANYKRQLNLVGISYDWSREVNSSLPDYYRWTQWLFLLLHQRGLAYRSDKMAVNWDPVDKTVLSNEEVVNGRGWRSNALVEKKYIPQWFFRITDYAQRLIDGLDTIQWTDGIKTMQREWIGRSEGAEVTFEIQAPPAPQTWGVRGASLTVFTTRPDTLWGATFMVLAPEHPLVETITTDEYRAEVAEYKEKAQRASDIERQSTERTKTGVFTGGYAVNPVNDEPIPIWIADYVLMGYGTGAIMAVPAHDQRDFEFAKKYGIPIKLVYKPEGISSADDLTEAIPGGGVMVETGPFTGLPNNKETVGKVIRWMEDQEFGKGVVNFRLRDWLISRQRYWGVPIPMIHCANCGTVPVPEADLPVVLPNVEKYQPTGTGESPLAAISEWVNVACPTCGGDGRRETDTMGGFACSSWYFLRFADPHNDKEPFSKEAVDYWLPVDLYSGGAEHAVMHLLYARFWTKVIHDAGLIQFDEPFTKLRNQGMLLAWTPGREIKADAETGDETDGNEPIENWKVLTDEEKATYPEDKKVYRWVKMSKSLKNVVTPDEIAERYGADSLRLFVCFVAPFEETVQWKDEGIEGAFRYLNRVWRIWHDLRPHFDANWKTAAVPELPEGAKKLRRKLHQTIRKVSVDIEEFRFNTAIAALMELTNELSLFRNALANRPPEPSEVWLVSEVLETLTLLISPFTPHLADEWWEALGYSGSTLLQAYPTFDEAAATEDAITVVVQVNGKLRDKLELPIGTSDTDAETAALASEKIQAELSGKTVRKVIVVSGKLVNIVVN